MKFFKNIFFVLLVIPIVFSVNAFASKTDLTVGLQLEPPHLDPTGAAAGAILAGFLFDLTGGYNFGFILCSIFTFCGALLFWVIPQIRYAKV